METHEVCVETSASYLVAAGFCYCCPAVSAEQRANHHYRPPELGTFTDKFVRGEVFKVETVCLEGKCSVSRFILLAAPYLHANHLQQFDEVVDVKYVGHIAYGNRFTGQQSGTYYLQSLVLGSLWRDVTLQPASSFYDKLVCGHDNS